jgi:hypothetical protein
VNNVRVTDVKARTADTVHVNWIERVVLKKLRDIGDDHGGDTF